MNESAQQLHPCERPAMAGCVAMGARRLTARLTVLFVSFVAVGVVATFSGCASPESRIAENPELFASFPADVQAKVKQGIVEVGFNKDMVLLAHGKPDRRLAREDATGIVSETWIYTGVYYTHVPVYRSHHHYRRHGDHCDDYYFDRGWDDIPHPYDRLKLHFDGDRVTSIDLDER